MTRFLAVLGIAFAMVLAACTDNDQPDSGADGASEAVETIPDRPDNSEPVPAQGAQRNIDEALAWVVSFANGAELTEAEYTDRFEDEFRRQVPYSQMLLVQQDIGLQGPWQLIAAETTDYQAVAEISGEIRLAVQLSLEPTQSHRIVGLLFQPIEDFTPPADLDDAVSRLQQQGDLRLLTADIGPDRSCTPTTTVGEQTPRPLGSIFKLYVLGAVVDAVQRGELSWEEEVFIRDRLDSLPSGITQDQGDGTAVSVRELAELMISISDNTATDHLIDLLGREVVEGVQAVMGHTQPSLNVPFLTTRELFILKLALDDGERAEYLAATTEERRSLLVALADRPLPSLADIAAAAEPLAVETLEWFATPADVCRALAWLAEDLVAREILAMNPGSPAPPRTWDYVGFKGGSEPGLLAGSWLVEADGQRRAVVAILTSDRAFAANDESEAFQLMAWIRDQRPEPN